MTCLTWWVVKKIEPIGSDAGKPNIGRNTRSQT